VKVRCRGRTVTGQKLACGPPVYMVIAVQPVSLRYEQSVIEEQLCIALEEPRIL
jgi:hypothetical protein